MAQDARLRRRMIGFLRARLPELRLDAVHDPRSARGKRWELEVLLAVVLTGMLGGCKSLLDVDRKTIWAAHASSCVVCT